MTKTTYRLLFHFSSLFLKFHSFTPTTFLANLCTYEFFHFFNINASIQQVSELLCCFLFLLDHVWGTEPKLELMLNMSAKTTESSKPHIFLFISRWFDVSFKGRSTKSTVGFFPNNKRKNSTNMKNLKQSITFNKIQLSTWINSWTQWATCFNYINFRNGFKQSIPFTFPSPWFF